jgi:hypothetical protein
MFSRKERQLKEKLFEGLLLTIAENRESILLDNLCTRLSRQELECLIENVVHKAAVLQRTNADNVQQAQEATNLFELAIQINNRLQH